MTMPPPTNPCHMRLSEEDNKAFNRKYAEAVKDRDQCVAIGDAVGAKRARQQISHLHTYYKARQLPEEAETVWDRTRVELEQAVVYAALALAGHVRCNTFHLQVGGTTPPLYVCLTDKEQP